MQSQVKVGNFHEGKATPHTLRMVRMSSSKISRVSTLELKEQVVIVNEHIKSNGQLFHRGKLLTEITTLSKMPCLIVDIRSKVRPLV